MTLYRIMVMNMCALALWGCASQQLATGPTQEETRQVLEAAWLYHDYIADELVAGDEYDIAAFNDAHDDLLTADTLFLNNQLAHAHAHASQSLTVFQEMVGEFSRARYIPELEATLAELQNIVANDPDNPLSEYVPTLEHMLTNARDQQANPYERLLPIEQMREDMQQFRQLKKIINEGQRIEKEIGDVSFETGEYTLTEDGKTLLQGFAEEIIAMKEEWQQEFPDTLVLVKIKVVGYTDDQGFRRGSGVAQKLLEEARLEEPQDLTARNALLNQLLSNKRAQTIANHLDLLISQTIEDASLARVEKETIGKGSAIPPSVEAPYPENDPRRRISKIYSFVITQ